MRWALLFSGTVSRILRLDIFHDRQKCLLTGQGPDICAGFDKRLRDQVLVKIGTIVHCQYTTLDFGGPSLIDISDISP